MVLAVIVGIGSGFFDDFRAAAAGQEPDLMGAMSLVLASLALLGLGIFGPAIASGLVAGAPQLGAGAAVGTSAAAIGTVALAGGMAAAGARSAGGAALGAVRAGTAIGAGASSAYRLGQETSGDESVAAGLKGVGSAAGAAARSRASEAGGLKAAAERGRRAALFAGAGSTGADPAGQAEGGGDAPEWARRLRSEQSLRHHRHVALQAIKEGDRGGAPANPDIKEREG